MSRHLIIAGHGELRNGGFDTGATGKIPKGEHRYMEENLFPAMKKYANQSKNTFIFHSKYKVLDYGNLTSLAKQHQADTVTEIHYDWFNGGRGGHVIIHNAFAPDSLDKRLVKAIGNMVPLRLSFRGIKGLSGRTNLGMVNIARNNGINFRLLELGNGNSSEDANVMINNVDQFAKELIEAYDQQNHQASQSKPVQKKEKESYAGSSIVDYLNLRNIPSDLNNRKKLAKQYLGIDDYKGTSGQNISLLNAMRNNENQNNGSYVGKRVESIHNGSLRFYSTPSWSDSQVAGTLTKGYGFPTIVKKLKVGDGEQYEVLNSRGETYYITASSKYVKVV